MKAIARPRDKVEERLGLQDGLFFFNNTETDKCSDVT